MSVIIGEYYRNKYKPEYTPILAKDLVKGTHVFQPTEKLKYFDIVDNGVKSFFQGMQDLCDPNSEAYKIREAENAASRREYMKDPEAWWQRYYQREWESAAERYKNRRYGPPPWLSIVYQEALLKIHDMKQKEEKLLERNGWTITSRDPLTITHSTDGTMSGKVAEDKLADLQSNERTSVISFESPGKYPAKKGRP